jgi:hypothetical protein
MSTRQLADRARLLGEALEDRAPCRVAERRESVKSVSHNAP